MTRRSPARILKHEVGERVEDRLGRTGTVVEHLGRTRAVVSYDDNPRRDVVMYHSSLTITDRFTTPELAA